MSPKYSVVYYISETGPNPVKGFIDSLQNKQKAKVFRIFETYQEYGLTSITSHTRKLTGTPLWEIKIVGKDNIRIIYVVRTEMSILVIHGFVKKQQKTPQKEINTALERYENWKNGS